MKKLAFFLVVSLLAVPLFYSCEGDKGPQGEPGEQGEQGEQGIQGEQGEPGTANVFYSTWQTLPGGWRDSTMNGATVKVKHLNEDKITSAILNNGLVMAYFQWGNSAYLLPYTGNSSTYGPYTISDVPNLGKIIFSIFTHDNSGSVTFNSTVNFRYVIIPGGVLAKAATNYRMLSYKELCTQFNIPE